MKIIAKNKKAFFDFEVLQRFTAGLCLLGCEIKSIRSGNVNLKGSFIVLQKGEAWLRNVHISPWKFSSFKIDPLRERKLLLQKKELAKIARKLQEKGFSCVPVAIGLSPRGICKAEIALVRGKKKFDKRQSEKAKERSREIERKIKTFT